VEKQKNAMFVATIKIKVLKIKISKIKNIKKKHYEKIKHAQQFFMEARRPHSWVLPFYLEI
jgi:hypothetical protein